MLGRVPQTVVDDEDGGLRTALEASLELRGLSRVADNAQHQYLRSRPAPSPESIKRAKELDVGALGLHPLFSESLGAVEEAQSSTALSTSTQTLISCLSLEGSRCEEQELQRLQLVDRIRGYRARSVSWAPSPLTHSLPVGPREQLPQSLSFELLGPVEGNRAVGRGGDIKLWMAPEGSLEGSPHPCPPLPPA